MISEYATVTDIRDMMNALIEEGAGDYEVVCNLEYMLARKDEEPDVRHKSKTVNLGGYL